MRVVTLDWSAQDPAVAHAERQVLLLSPVWIAAMGVVMITGLHRRFDDLGFLVFGLALALPFLVLPLVHPHASERDLPVIQRVGVRMNAWVFVLVFVGNYFVTHYFFDLVGMRYGFPTTWRLDSPVMGEGAHEVPVFLYPVTHAYFMSYYVTGRAVLRVVTRRLPGPGPWFLGLLVVSYAIAFAETWFMAVDMLADVFSYADRTRMLLVGSLFYGSFFVVSMPIFERLDRDRRATFSSTMLDALAAAMLVLLALEGWALLVGRLM